MSDGELFRDERRVRERLQALADAGLVRNWPAAPPGGGLVSVYRLTLEGYRAAFPESAEAPPRSSLNAIAPSRVRHTLATADAIVHTLAACHERGVKVQRAVGDGPLTLEVGEHRQQPDFHIQLGYARKTTGTATEWYAQRVLFLIAVPANNARGPRYMEKSLAAMHQARLRHPVTLIYGSTDEQVGLFVRCHSTDRDAVLQPILANYPHATVTLTEEWSCTGSIVTFQVGSDDAQRLAEQLGRYPRQSSSRHA